MVGSGSGTGSGKFEQIRIREKSLDPTGSGSATLPPRNSTGTLGQEAQPVATTA